LKKGGNWVFFKRPKSRIMAYKTLVDGYKETFKDEGGWKKCELIHESKNAWCRGEVK